MRGGFSDALVALRQRCSGHDPGRVLVDLAVMMLADGGEAISGLAALREEPGVFGSVASIATAWRVLDRVDAPLLDRLRMAGAVARKRAWLARGRRRPGQRYGETSEHITFRC